MGSATLRSGYTLYVDAWVQSQNQAGNYSIIAWRRYVKKTSSSWFRGQWQANTERVWSNVGAIRETSGWWYDFLNNAIQLDVSGTFRLNHDASGNATYEVASYVNIVQIGSATASSGRKTAKRISVAPKQPGRPVINQITPVSAKLVWPAPPDSGGGKLEKYIVSYWDNPEGTGSPKKAEVSAANNALVLKGLTPNIKYRVVVQAKSVGVAELSPYSNHTLFFTPPGVRIRVAGVWKMAVPYVRTNGIWKMGVPYVRKDGVWKTPS